MEHAKLVAQTLEIKSKTPEIDIETFMESGIWSAVYASTEVSDDGVLFFETVYGKKQFKDAWGGHVDPSERKQLTCRTRKPGAPENPAKCFARRIVDE